jgi:hyperosmotically inducible periplasmic protein
MTRARTLLLATIAAAGLSGCDRTELNPAVSAKTAQAEARSPADPAARAQAAAPAPAPAPASVPRDTITDSVITAKIKTAILSDPSMTGTDVSVNTERGVVSLSGNVKSQEQIAMASAHAQRQDGVMRVDTQLAMNTQ